MMRSARVGVNPHNRIPRMTRMMVDVASKMKYLAMERAAARWTVSRESRTSRGKVGILRYCMYGTMNWFEFATKI